MNRTASRRAGMSVMPDRMMSTRAVASELIIWSKLVSSHLIVLPRRAASASPRSMSKPTSLPLAGSLYSSGGEFDTTAARIGAPLARIPCAWAAGAARPSATARRPMPVSVLRAMCVLQSVRQRKGVKGKGSAAHGGNEFARARVPGLQQDLAGGAGLDDPALVHEYDAAGHVACKAQFVGHDHHRHARGGQVAHDREHLAPQSGSERGGRLVEQHQLRTHRQRARKGHALLLPARQLDRERIALVRQADTRQQRLRLGNDLVACAALHPQRAFGHVLQRRHMREQVQALEHHAGLAPLTGDFRFRQRVQLVADAPVTDQFTAHPERAGGHGFELVDAAQKGALARARRADDAQHLAGGDIDRDALERLERAEALAHIDGAHDGFAVGAAHAHCLALARPAPRAKWDSTRDCSSASTVTTAMYQMPATISNSITRALA